MYWYLSFTLDQESDGEFSVSGIQVLRHSRIHEHDSFGSSLLPGSVCTVPTGTGILRIPADVDLR